MSECQQCPDREPSLSPAFPIMQQCQLASPTAMSQAQPPVPTPPSATAAPPYWASLGGSSGIPTTLTGAAITSEDGALDSFLGTQSL